MKRHLSKLDYTEFACGVYDLHGDSCWACRTDTANRWKCVDRSQGITDWHHVISQQTICKNVDPELVQQALRDSRNGVPLARCHHGLVEAAFCRIEIPDPVWAFAADYSLAWALERMEAA